MEGVSDKVVEKPAESGKRPAWEEYFLQIAHLASQRSTCLRRQVGAVIVKDRMILSTGYNGVPRGIVHCSQVGCIRNTMNVPSGERHELCRGLHAEQNAIVQAAIHGVNIRWGDIYCTNFPCVICAKMIINADIRRIYYSEGYSDHLSGEMLGEAGVEITRLTTSAGEGGGP